MPEIDKIRVGSVTYDIGGVTGSGMYIIVNGNTASQAITAGQYIYVQNNTSLSKGVYRATANIASGGAVGLSNTTVDTNGALNTFVANDANAVTTISTIEKGLANIVNGDTTTEAIPSGAYAYIKNNTHGLAEGFYQNKSSNAFPTSGGSATSSVFSAVATKGILNLLNRKRLTAQTLAVGSTTLTFTDTFITTSSTIEAYADMYGLAPTAITVTNGRAVLTFPAQQSAVSVFIVVW